MYVEKKFEHLFGLKGISDTMLKNHFTLYSGYVNNASLLAGELKDNDGKDNSPKYSELKRRFAWEYNGMKLHEFFFENLSKEKFELSSDSKLAKKLKEDFGSLEKWEKDFKNTASMRGIGWAVLFYDTDNKKLLNAWVNEHDVGHLFSTIPILIIDVFEHAFMQDYGLKRKDYVDAIMQAINWNVVEKRFSKA